MRTGSCDMTCSPDRITPQCPVLNCVSASPGTCGNMRCEVNTYSHVLYWFSVKSLSVVVINPPTIASFLQKKTPRCLSQCLLLVLSSVIQFEKIGCFINSVRLYWKISSFHKFHTSRRVEKKLVVVNRRKTCWHVCPVSANWISNSWTSQIFVVSRLAQLNIFLWTNFFIEAIQTT